MIIQECAIEILNEKKQRYLDIKAKKRRSQSFCREASHRLIDVPLASLTNVSTFIGTQESCMWAGNVIEEDNVDPDALLDANSPEGLLQATKIAGLIQPGKETRKRDMAYRFLNLGQQEALHCGGPRLSIALQQAETMANSPGRVARLQEAFRALYDEEASVKESGRAADDLPDVFIVHGTADLLIPLSEAHAQKEVFNRAWLLEIQGAGHVFTREQNVRVFRTWLRMVNGRSPPRDVVV